MNVLRSLFRLITPPAKENPIAPTQANPEENEGNRIFCPFCLKNLPTGCNICEVCGIFQVPDSNNASSEIHVTPESQRKVKFESKPPIVYTYLSAAALRANEKAKRRRRALLTPLETSISVGNEIEEVDEVDEVDEADEEDEVVDEVDGLEEVEEVQES